MKFNRHGDWCAGKGGIVISCNGVVVLPYESGAANWLDDDRVIGSSGDGIRYNLKTWHRLTQAVEFVQFGAGGANELAAGGGVWAAWRDGFGLFTSTGLHLAAGGLVDVGPDGAIAYVANREDGFPVRVRELKGHEWELTPGIALEVQLLGAGRAIWVNPQFIVETVGLDVPIAAGPVRGPKALEVAGEWWLLSWRHPDGPLTLRPFNTSDGYIVHVTADAFNFDMVALNSTTIRVGWAITEGEPPEHVRTRDLDLTLARVDLNVPVIPTSKVPPMSTRSDRFWFGPNIGSPDLVRLFDDPTVLKDVGVFSLYVQHLLNLGPTIGPNTYEALTANHVFKKLKAAGIPLSIEMGTVLSDLEAIAKVTAAGGDIPIVSMNEPLTDAKVHRPMSPQAKLVEVIAFIQQARVLGVPHVVWIEAWPEIPLQQQLDFLASLIAAGAEPDAWHLDIDWHRAVKEKRSTTDFITAVQQAAAAHGIKVGAFLVGYEHRTDAEYAADVQLLATNLHAMAVSLDHILVQAWATRTGGGQDIPLNLGPSGLLASLAQTVRILGAAVPPADTSPLPTPTELKNMIAYSPPVPGFLAGELAPHPDGDGVIVVKPNGKILCITPDGGVEERPRAAAGAWEKFQKTGTSLLAARDGGKVYVLSLQGA